MVTRFLMFSLAISALTLLYLPEAFAQDRHGRPAPDAEITRRRVEAAADTVIERWHQTLDMKRLFDELYTSNPEQRQQNLKAFYVVYRFWVGSNFESVDKDVDESLMRDFYFTFWNYMYLVGEYDLAYREPGVHGVANPPELEKHPPRRVTPDKKISRIQVTEYMNQMRSALPVYRRHLDPQVFRTARYLDNLKREKERSDAQPKHFQIMRGLPSFGVPSNVDVYYLRKGLFRFYFIEENGRLKVLTLGYEL